MAATCHGNTLNDYTTVAVSLIFQMPQLVGKMPDHAGGTGAGTGPVRSMF